MSLNYVSGSQEKQQNKSFPIKVKQAQAYEFKLLFNCSSFGHFADVYFLCFILLEQYASTKQSWMEDYCKQDKEVNAVSSEEWMGSSEDSPCFGQSMMLINLSLFETILTSTVICLKYYKHKQLAFVAYSELLEVIWPKH